MYGKLVDTALGEVRVRVAGAGQPILFWPSLLMTGDMWSAQADHFSRTHQVILVDSPGHGESQRLTAPFTFAECAQCIVDVLDGLDVEHAHFVGNSWGGMIGGTFAATHADRIDKAVLMNCTASAAGRWQKLEYGALLQMAGVLGGIRAPLTRSVLKAFLGPTTFGTRPDVVAGVEDATFPNSETKAMADAIPGAEFVVLDGVAHLAALEDPALVNRLIEDFLAR